MKWTIVLSSNLGGFTLTESGLMSRAARATMTALSRKKWRCSVLARPMKPTSMESPGAKWIALRRHSILLYPSPRARQQREARLNSAQWGPCFKRNTTVSGQSKLLVQNNRLFQSQQIHLKAEKLTLIFLLPYILQYSSGHAPKKNKHSLVFWSNQLTVNCNIKYITVWRNY